MDIDLEELAAIIELLDKAEFTQFHFEKGDLRIAVSRGGVLPGSPLAPAAGATATTTSAVSSPAPAQPAPVVAAAPKAPAASTSSVTSPLDGLAADETVVTSPMLGTVYRSPKPGEPPFVQVGAEVADDDVLCIVEVMKLMNSVTAGIAGEVTRVLVSDGDLVEFEQPLFVIRCLP